MKRWSKKITAILIVFAIILSLFACSKPDYDPTENCIQPPYIPSTLTVDNPDTKANETVSIRYLAETNGDEGFPEAIKKEITDSTAVITVYAFGFLITYGEESARSVLTVEIPNVHKAVPNENEEDSSLYKFAFESRFELSEYEETDSLGYINIISNVSYTYKYNIPHTEEKGESENNVTVASKSLSITEVGDGLKIETMEEPSDIDGYGITVPPQLCTNLDGENHNYKTALTSFDYSWRGWERRDDATISEWNISSDATGFFEIFNPEEYRHDITEYEVKRVYSTDLSGEDVREERYEHIIHDGFFDIFREHKNYVTFTPEQNRIFVFEIEYEYGVATYKIKLLEFGYDSLS